MSHQISHGKYRYKAANCYFRRSLLRYVHNILCPPGGYFHLHSVAWSLSSWLGVSCHCSRTQDPDSLGRGMGHLALGSLKNPQDVLRSRDVHLGKQGALQSPLVTSKRPQSIDYCVIRAIECLVLAVSSTSTTQSSTYRCLDFSILYREILQASGPTDLWRKGKEYAAACLEEIQPKK